MLELAPLSPTQEVFHVFETKIKLPILLLTNHARKFGMYLCDRSVSSFWWIIGFSPMWIHANQQCNYSYWESNQAREKKKKKNGVWGLHDASLRDFIYYLTTESVSFASRSVEWRIWFSYRLEQHTLVKARRRLKIMTENLMKGMLPCW